MTIIKTWLRKRNKTSVLNISNEILCAVRFDGVKFLVTVIHPIRNKGTLVFKKCCFRIELYNFFLKYINCNKHSARVFLTIVQKQKYICAHIIPCPFRVEKMFVTFHQERINLTRLGRSQTGPTYLLLFCDQSGGRYKVECNANLSSWLCK